MVRHCSLGHFLVALSLLALLQSQSLRTDALNAGHGTVRQCGPRPSCAQPAVQRHHPTSRLRSHHCPSEDLASLRTWLAAGLASDGCSPAALHSGANLQRRARASRPRARRCAVLWVEQLRLLPGGTGLTEAMELGQGRQGTIRILRGEAGPHNRSVMLCTTATPARPAADSAQTALSLSIDATTAVTAAVWYPGQAGPHLQMLLMTRTPHQDQAMVHSS
jgi:hypothetical protein